MEPSVNNSFGERFMKAWTLTVLLDAESESCTFATIAEAFSTLRSLVADYGLRLSQATLTNPAGQEKSLAVELGKQQRRGLRNTLFGPFSPTPQSAR